jgi:diguanylate cyclase (GGDEF)-like protein
LRAGVDIVRRLIAWLLPRDLPQDARERSRAHLFVGTVLAYLVAVLITLAIFFAVVEAPNRAMFLVRLGATASASIGILFVLALFRATGRRFLAAQVFAVIASIALVGLTPVIGTTTGPMPALYVLVPATVTLLAGRASGIGWGVALLGAAVFLRVLEQRGVALAVQAPPDKLVPAATAIYFVVFVLVVAALQVYDRLGDRLAEELEGERRRFAHLAAHDPLTKLPNRLVFQSRVREAMGRTSRTNYPFALVYLDLDGFKSVNDRFGHSIGDAVLQEVAARLTACTRENDVTARLGGDEFALLLDGVSTVDEAATVAAKILREVTEPMRFGGDEVGVGASLGFALHPECGGDAESLEQLADGAMYAAKERRGSAHRVSRSPRARPAVGGARRDRSCRGNGGASPSAPERSRSTPRRRSSHTRGMNIRVSLTADGIGVVYTSSGALTGRDLVEADERLRAKLEANPALRYLLIDHSAVLEEKVDTKSLKTLAATTRVRLTTIPEGLLAIVAPSDVLFGLSRMWAMMAEHPNLAVEVTRERETAVAWLEQQLTQRQLPFRLS